MIKIKSEGIMIDYIKTLLKDKYNLDTHTSYYDNTTHEYLGKYLRELKENGIDLLSMYNLYTGKLIKGYKINNANKLIKTTSEDKQFNLIAIPIQTNHTYTLYFNAENKYPIVVAVVAFDGDNFISTNLLDLKTYTIDWDSPVTYSTKKEVENPEQLYMIIQVPISCNQRLVVEGDMTKSTASYVAGYKYENNGITYGTTAEDYIKIYTNPNEFISDDRTPVAVSDELVPYLLHYVVTKESEEAKILHVQQLMLAHSLLLRVGTNYTGELRNGSYTDEMRKWLYDFNKKYATDDTATGLINKGVERVLFKGELDE